MRYFPYFLCVPFVLMGLSIAVYGLIILHKAWQSAGWPNTAGQVTQSQVVLQNSSYSPTVQYTYTVGGIPYTGTDIEVGARVGTSDGRFARVYAARYPTGAGVSVHYDPDDPATAVLEPGATKRSYLPLAFGLGFALFGAWFCLLFWLFDEP